MEVRFTAGQPQDSAGAAQRRRGHVHLQRAGACEGQLAPVVVAVGTVQSDRIHAQGGPISQAPAQNRVVERRPGQRMRAFGKFQRTQHGMRDVQHLAAETVASEMRLRRTAGQQVFLDLVESPTGVQCFHERRAAAHVGRGEFGPVKRGVPPPAPMRHAREARRRHVGGPGAVVSQRTAVLIDRQHAQEVRHIVFRRGCAGTVGRRADHQRIARARVLDGAPHVRRACVRGVREIDDAGAHFHRVFDGVGQVERLGAGARREAHGQDATARRHARKSLHIAVPACSHAGGVCAGNFAGIRRQRVMRQIALDVWPQQRVIDLHAFVDDGNEDFGAAARARPGAFHAQPIEGGTEAARLGRRHRHVCPLRARTGRATCLLR